MAPSEEPNTPEVDPEAHTDLAATTRSGKKVTIRLIADKSFFHDAFRIDYKPQIDAEWLLAYLVARRAIDPRHRIAVTASSIIERLEQELRLRPHAGGAVSVGLVIRNLVRPYHIPPEENLSWAPLYVARLLSDAGTISLVISSVKNDRWMQRMKDAGVEWKVKGFQPGMSSLRALEHAWFVPFDTHGCSHILEKYDPLYGPVTTIIGLPERGRRRPPAKPGSSRK